jgi:hypothetical protein
MANAAELRIELRKGLLTLLNTYSGFTWGDGERPETSAKPYGILYMLDAINVSEDLGYVSCPARCTVQLTMVGITAEQVLWASKAAMAALVGRSSGTYSRALTVTGATVMQRELVQARRHPQRLHRRSRRSRVACHA